MAVVKQTASVTSGENDLKGLSISIAIFHQPINFPGINRANKEASNI